MQGDTEIDESRVAELVKVSQTSVDRTSVSLLLAAVGQEVEEEDVGVGVGGEGLLVVVAGGCRGSQVRG